MTYESFIPSIERHLFSIDNPRVLEIGVDTGNCFLNVARFLVENKQQFEITGVDIFVQVQVKATLANLTRTGTQRCELIEQNSLVFLPVQKLQYDVVFLDGDHNYYTVAQELKLLSRLLHDKSVLVIDDYYGRWSNNDYFYGESTYVGNKLATERVDTKRHGIRPAVDEFLQSNKGWLVASDAKKQYAVIMCRDNDVFKIVTS